MTLKKLADRNLLLIVQKLESDVPEPNKIPEQPPKTRPYKVSMLRKQPSEVHASIFQILSVIADTETHFRRLTLEPQLSEKVAEARVSRIIENDKPCVD